MDIDRKRTAAVRALETLRYTWSGGQWLAPACAAITPLSFLAKADAMHGVHWWTDRRARWLHGSDDETELKALVDAIEAYEAIRWPLGKDPNVPGGKG